MNKYFFDAVSKKYYKSIEDYRIKMLEDESSFDGCSNLEKYEDIEKWHLNCKLFESLDTVPPGYSLGFEYLYINNDEVVGMLNFRPLALTHPFLKQYGGHIGYSIKPEYRNKSIGSKMLKDFLKICKKEYDLDKILITCLSDNIASKRVIINNGGVFESDIIYPPNGSKLERYWISI